MNINEQKTALCYFLQIQDSDIFYLKIWIRDKNSLFAPLLTGQYFCCWFSPHPYFMFLLCLLPHSGSILDSQLSWESGKFQLARWSHEVVWFSTWVPPTHPTPLGQNLIINILEFGNVLKMICKLRWVSERCQLKDFLNFSHGSIPFCYTPLWTDESNSTPKLLALVLDSKNRTSPTTKMWGFPSVMLICNSF